jgi:capsular polysaccharide export protein
MSKAAGRVFLFLQGPHGPFFMKLAMRLAAEGALVRRIAFNPGDEAEWRGAGPLDRYLGPDAESGTAYSEWLAHYLTAHRITDILLYGDARPEHAQAIEAARRHGIMCHCLEEGYLRPHCVTYERWGNNGNSPLCDIPIARIAQAMGPTAPPLHEPGDGWGAYHPHLWHSALYHARLLVPSRRYGRHRNRRGVSLWGEFANYLRRVAGYPLRRLSQRWRVRQLLTSGRSYHLALLQLSFDSSMQEYSGYTSSAQFARDCIEAFARGALVDEYLVLKSHPFEDGRERLSNVIAETAERLGLGDRVMFLDGGPGLAALLDGARSAVTINSTAAQQALWRGLPVAALEQAVYTKPGLVSSQSLEAFFAAPARPDQQSYWQFRGFLAKTSQFRGSFYSRAGITALLKVLPPAFLSPADAYDRVLANLPDLDRAPVPVAKLVSSRPPAPAEARDTRKPQRVAV